MNKRQKMIKFLQQAIKNAPKSSDTLLNQDKVIIKGLRTTKILDDGHYILEHYNAVGNGDFSVRSEFAYETKEYAEDFDLYMACEKVIRNRLWHMGLNCRFTKAKHQDKHGMWKESISYLGYLSINLKFEDYMKQIFF